MIDFIYPLYLVLIAAAAVPLIIHLMQRYRARVVAFSSVDLLTGAERRTIRWIRLRQILLLLLRIVILLLIALALTHPLIRGVLTGGIETHLPTSVVMVIDNSMSMEWTVDGRSTLERSLDRARQVLDELNENDRSLLLIVPGPGAEPLRIEGREEIVRALDELKPIPGGPDLSRLIGLAIESLGDMPGPGREIHVYTDLQSNAFGADDGTAGKADNRGGPGDAGNDRDGEGDGGKAGGEEAESEDGIRLVLLTEREEAVWNRAITGITREDAPVSPKGTVYLEIEVSEEGPSTEAGDFYLRVDHESGEHYIREVPLDGSGRGTLRIPIEGRRGETVRGRVEIDPDPLAMDNRSFFTVQLPERPRVWYLSGRDPVSPLGTALEVLAGEPGSIDLRRQLPDVDLDHRDVIVLDSPRRGMADRLLPLLSRGIQRGNVVLFPPGTESDVGELNGILGMIGLPERYLDPVGTGEAGYTKIGGWSSTSGDIGRFVRAYAEDLSNIRFFRYYSIQGGDPDPGRRIETIDYESGAPWITMASHGGGWRLLFTSGCGASWNDFHRHPLFVPFIDTLLRDIIARGRSIFTAATPGSWIDIDLPGIAEGTEVDLVGPNGETRRVFCDGGKARFRTGETVGNYRLEVLGEEIAGFSVNPDGRESALSECPVEDIRRAASGIEPTIVRAGAGLEESLLLERGGRDIWWEFLALALLLLIVEGIVTQRNRGSRR